MSLPKCNVSSFDPSRVIIVFHNINITKTSISISRTVGESSEQKPGVLVEYRKSLTKTIRELDELEMLPNGSHNHLKIKVNDGMDGAGHQLTHEDPKGFARISKIMARQTHNVYPWVFVC